MEIPDIFQKVNNLEKSIDLTYQMVNGQFEFIKDLISRFDKQNIEIESLKLVYNNILDRLKILENRVLQSYTIPYRKEDDPLPEFGNGSYVYQWFENKVKSPCDDSELINKSMYGEIELLKWTPTDVFVYVSFRDVENVKNNLDFFPRSSYGLAMPRHKDEIGKIGNVRFLYDVQ